MKRERHPGIFALSVALHVAFGAVLLWVLSIPAPFTQWLAPRKVAVPAGERITYMRVPDGGANVAQRPGGNGRPPRGAVRVPERLVAPVGIPSNVPVTKPGAPKVEEQGTGPVMSMGGAGPGIEPELHDPRIWVPPGAVIFTPRPDNAGITDANAMARSLATFKDSIAKKNADALKTVFESGGKKYGVDGQNIYIADYKIPAALLALIPIHPTGYATPDQAALNRQTAEINYNAGRALDAEDFKTAIKRIRQRKEREHEQQLAAEGKGPAPTAITAEPPVHKEIRTDPIALQSP